LTPRRSLGTINLSACIRAHVATKRPLFGSGYKRMETPIFDHPVNSPLALRNQNDIILMSRGGSIKCSERKMLKPALAELSWAFYWSRSLDRSSWRFVRPQTKSD